MATTLGEQCASSCSVGVHGSNPLPPSATPASLSLSEPCLSHCIQKEEDRDFFASFISSLSSSSSPFFFFFFVVLGFELRDLLGKCSAT
jgi:hypothetical protein